jgi:UDP-N-acetyl-D-mannosaminuronic acid dehydrogenase
LNQKICVVGLGYIGLPTAAMFAKNGFEVVGVDVNENAVNLLNEGKVHIEEVGLEELVNKVVETGKLRASTTPEVADAYIIAVPTPIHEDKTANIDYVVSATKSILPFVKHGDVIIVESTIPPRTIDDVVAPIFEEFGCKPGEDVYLAHCPERVLPGRILIELVENTRIVGGINRESAKKAADVYRTFVTGEVIETSAVTAEMTKLMENTYRDVNIALANELTKISDKLGINSLEVIELANKHPRVNLHTPGPGVGGHCLAIDPYFIIEKAENESILISDSRMINNSMPEFVVDKVKDITKGLINPKIAVFGLTYKGNIDDVRESPAMEVIDLLEKENYLLGLYDPHVKQEQVRHTLLDFKEAIDGADCLLVLTDHNEFKLLDEDKINKFMNTAVVLDTKNCVDIQSSNIKYINFGNLYEINQLKLQVN